MPKKIKADEIPFTIVMDVKGVQSELYSLSSASEDLKQKNKSLQEELKKTEKQMAEAEKAMRKLESAGKDQGKEYERAKIAYDQAAVENKKFTDQININSNAIKENDNRARSLTSSLKLEDMTMNQLKSRASQLTKELNNTSKSANPAAYDALEKELTQVNTRMGELKVTSKGVGESFGGIASGFGGMLTVFGGNLLTKATGKIKEWVSVGIDWVKTGKDMANGADGVIRAFNQLSDSSKIMNDLKKATSGTISELSLMEKTLRGKELGVPVKDMANLMDYARRQAQLLNKDVNYMADSIVDGIGRKSTLVLDNLGISATRVQAEVKKTGDFTQAVIKIVNEELEKQGEYALTGADKAAQSSVKWENAQLKVGKRFQWLGELWDKVSGGIADKISKLAGDTRSLTEQYQDQIKKVADLEVNTKTLAERYNELKSRSSLTKEESIEINKIMNTLSSTIPGIVTEWDKYGNILSINTDKVYQFIEAEKARLAYMNRDAIKEAENNIKTWTDKMNDWQKTYDAKDYYGNPWYSPEVLAEAEKQIREYGQMLEGAEQQLNYLTGKSIGEQVTQQKKKIEANNKFNEMTKEQLAAWIIMNKDAGEAVAKYRKVSTEEGEKLVKETRLSTQEYLDLAKKIYEEKYGGNTNAGKTDKEILQAERKALNNLLESLETAHQGKMADIRKKYLADENITEAEYKQKLFAQEQAYYLLSEQALDKFKGQITKEEVKDDVSKRVAQLQNKRLEQEAKFRTELEKIILNANPEKKEKQEFKNRLAAVGLFEKDKTELLLRMEEAQTDDEKSNIQKRLDNLDQYGIDRNNLTAEQLKALEELEKQHTDNLDQIRRNTENKRKAKAKEDFDASFKTKKEEIQAEIAAEEQRVKLNTGMGALTGNAAFEAEVGLQQKRIALIQAEIEARKVAGVEYSQLLKKQQGEELAMTNLYVNEFNRRKEEYSQYGKSIGSVLGDVITGQENALQSFADTMIDILFDTLTQIINAEIAKVVATATGAIARTTAEQIASKGFLGIGTAAVLTGVITGAMTVAKTALKGLLKSKSGDSKSSSSITTYKRVVKQQAEGKYDVIGEQDGRTYSNVPYTGPAKTGMVYTPTLVGERGSELVVSSPDMKALQKHINYPVIVQALKDVRTGTVPQRAAGKYDSVGAPSSNVNNYYPDNTELVNTLSRLNNALRYLEKNGLDVNYQQFESVQNTMNQVKKMSSK